MKKSATPSRLLRALRPRRKKENQPHLLKKNSAQTQNCDRFIASRASMDFDVARFLLTRRSSNENNTLFEENYKTKLASTLFNGTNIHCNKSKILSWRSNHGPLVNLGQEDVLSNGRPKQCQSRRYIPHIPDKTLDAPDLIDDYYSNVLDWSSNNILSLALGCTVYLFDADRSSTSTLLIVDDDVGPISSLSWAPDGKHIAIGLTSSTVQLWDSASNRQLRGLNAYAASVGVLSWNDHILTTGSLDGSIINHDVRIRKSIVQTYKGHGKEVCGLKWSPSGQLLASGGNDNLLYIWDRNMSSSNSITQYLHRINAHRGAVRALSWCPFQRNFLASGGDSEDKCIKFWNIHTGACLNTIDTASEVCSLIWNKHERELLSSHGYPGNQLTLWKYPSMLKITELTGHSSRVLHLAESPDRCTIASAAGDETLRFWQIFGIPGSAERMKTKQPSDPFHDFLMNIR